MGVPGGVIGGYEISQFQVLYSDQQFFCASMRFLHTFISHSKGNTEILPGEAPQGPPGSLFQVKPPTEKIQPFKL